MAKVTTTPWGRPFGIDPVEVLTNYNPGSTPTTYNLDLSAYTPAGTKAAFLSMDCRITSTVSAGTAGIRKTSGSVSVARALTPGVANHRMNVSCWVELDANRTCDLHFSSADFDSVYVYLSVGMIP